MRDPDWIRGDQLEPEDAHQEPDEPTDNNLWEPDYDAEAYRYERQKEHTWVRRISY